MCDSDACSVDQSGYGSGSLDDDGEDMEDDSDGEAIYGHEG